MSDTISIDEAVLDAGFKTKSVAVFPKYIKANIERVKLLDISIARMYCDDEGYQRGLSNMVHTIYREYDPKYFLLPLISRRKWENDKLVAIDGQTRLIAARQGGVQYVDCVVIDMNSVAEESNAFLKINKGRKQLSSVVISQASHVTGNSPEDTKFIKSVKDAGFELHEKAGHLRLKAATGVKKAARQYGNDNLVNALLAYKRIWPNHDEVNADVVRGLAFLIWAFRKNHEPQKVTAEALARNINGIMLPFSLIPKIVNTSAAKYNHQDRDFRMASVMIDHYNGKLKGRARLALEVAQKAWESMKK